MWMEDGRQSSRTFDTYQEACAFKRDWCLPLAERRIPPSLAAGAPPAGYVYFVQFGDELSPVKIGWTKRPTARIASLATAHAHEPSLRALIPGPQSLERELHRRYERHRLRGELFTPAVIDALIADLGSPLGSTQHPEIGHVRDVSESAEKAA